MPRDVERISLAVMRRGELGAPGTAAIFAAPRAARPAKRFDDPESHPSGDPYVQPGRPILLEEAKAAGVNLAPKG